MGVVSYSDSYSDSDSDSEQQIVTDCYRLLQTVTNCCRPLQSAAECCRVLQSAAECCRPAFHETEAAAGTVCGCIFLRCMNDTCGWTGEHHALNTFASLLHEPESRAYRPVC